MEGQSQARDVSNGLRIEPPSSPRASTPPAAQSPTLERMQLQTILSDTLREATPRVPTPHSQLSPLELGLRASVDANIWRNVLLQQELEAQRGCVQPADVCSADARPADSRPQTARPTSPIRQASFTRPLSPTSYEISADWGNISPSGRRVGSRAPSPGRAAPSSRRVGGKAARSDMSGRSASAWLRSDAGADAVDAAFRHVSRFEPVQTKASPGDPPPQREPPQSPKPLPPAPKEDLMKLVRARLAERYGTTADVLRKRVAVPASELMHVNRGEFVTMQKLLSEALVTSLETQDSTRRARYRFRARAAQHLDCTAHKNQHANQACGLIDAEAFRIQKEFERAVRQRQAALKTEESNKNQRKWSACLRTATRLAFSAGIAHNQVHGFGSQSHAGYR